MRLKNASILAIQGVLVSKSVADSFGPQDEVTGIPTILRQEVERRGTISFARFMETALYCPKIGYYERDAGQVGREGDFHTSVSVGGLFGELLAWRFAEWLAALGPGPLHLVEAGAHDGQLARDILEWLAVRRPALFGRLAYWLIEPSVDRQNRQRLKLENFSDQIRWFGSSDAMPRESVRGVLFSNELFDAFPVQCLRWCSPRQRWIEWGVGWESDRFVWKPMDGQQDWTHSLLRAGFEFGPELLAVLPDGFQLEISTRASEWWRSAAGALAGGKLVTIDYGWTSMERLEPSRAGGTVRGYSQHHLVDDVLAAPGEYDITAAVNFTQLQRTGEEAGLTTEEWIHQEEFLTRSAIDGIKSGTLGWTGERVRQLQTLIHPDHFGRAFRVLVQSRAS